MGIFRSLGWNAGMGGCVGKWVLVVFCVGTAGWMDGWMDGCIMKKRCDSRWMDCIVSYICMVRSRVHSLTGTESDERYGHLFVGDLICCCDIVTIAETHLYASGICVRRMEWPANPIQSHLTSTRSTNVDVVEGAKFTFLEQGESCFGG